MRIQKLDENSRKNLLEDLLKRSPNNYGQYEQGVTEILANVKANGDQALFEYTKKFDQADLNAGNIKVTDAEIEEAYALVDPKLVEIIRKSLANIRTYHENGSRISSRTEKCSRSHKSRSLIFKIPMTSSVVSSYTGRRVKRSSRKISRISS